MTELSSNIDSKLSISIIQQLQRKRICTVIQFISEDSEKLVTCTELPLKDILEIKRNIMQKYGGIMKSAFDLFKTEQNNIIPTNLLSLDNILKGGLYPGQIYEICGTSSSGKTQLCLTLASNIALEPKNIVRYIDTKRDFSGSRIEQILSKKYNKQVIDQVMNRIKVCCIYKLDQLFRILRLLTISLKEEKAEYRTRIIIIDSLPAIIFKFSQSHETTVALNHIANMCHFIANEFHLSIVTVNLVTRWNTINEEGSTSTNTSENCNEMTPALGKYWSHVPNTRLLIEKIGIESRKISVWKSFQLESNVACTLSINDCGILCS